MSILFHFLRTGNKQFSFYLVLKEEKGFQKYFYTVPHLFSAVFRALKQEDTCILYMYGSAEFPERTVSVVRAFFFCTFFDESKSVSLEKKF